MYKNYLRVTRNFRDMEFIVGVEFFDHDNFSMLNRDVTFFLETAIIEFQSNYSNEDNKFYAMTLKNAAKKCYKGRQFFLEIGNDDDSWLQVCPAEVSYVSN